MIKVALIGFGYWGTNILRNVLLNTDFQMISIVDLDGNRLKAAQQLACNLKITSDVEQVINDPNIDAVIIATPVTTHFALAYQALSKGKHVLIEKPMCTTVDECHELIALAKQFNVVLMVDHTFIMTDVVQKIYKIYKDGLLGKVHVFDSMRTNFGSFREDVNVMWDLAPHDFSIIDYIFNEEPFHVESSGHSHLNNHLPDVAYLTMYYASGMVARVNVSWISPVKVRRITIGGTHKMLVWDDLHLEEKIKIYNKNIFYKNHPRNAQSNLSEYLAHDVLSVCVSEKEALQKVIEHFSQVIRKKEESLMDGRRGLRVVRLLECAQDSLDKSLKNLNDKIRETNYLNLQSCLTT